LIILSFKDSTYNAQFNLCFYLFCRPFPEVPAEPSALEQTHPVSLRIPSWLAFRFRPSGLKTQKTKLSKNFVPFRSVAPAFASHQPIGRFETLAVAACSQNHSLTCESAVISGRVTLAGPVPASTSFSSFCRSFFRNRPRTFCRPPARFAALRLSSQTNALQRSPGLSTEPKTDPFEPAFTSVLAPAFSLSRSSAFAAGRDT
jgi:hypothetical protein